MNRLLVGSIFPLFAALTVGCQSAEPDMLTTPDLVRGQAPGESRSTAAPIIPASASTEGIDPNNAETQIRVVAMIGSDIVITDDEVWQMVRQRARDYVRLQGSERTNTEKKIFQEELRKLIERELIVDDFLTKVKANKPEAIYDIEQQADRMADQQLGVFKRENGLNEESKFLDALQVQGLTAQGITRQLKRSAMMNMYLKQLMEDKKRDASLSEVRDYYRSHAKEFRVEDRAKWLDLFVAYSRFNNQAEANASAEKLYRQAVGGADFVKLVKEHGHGDSALRDGEGIGEKRSEIQPVELESTIFRLKANEISAPIPTSTGLHIIKVLERDVAGIHPFDKETQLFIREKLSSQMRTTEFDRLIEDLWRKTTVRITELP